MEFEMEKEIGMSEDSKLNIEKVLEDLGKERPLFHSEADFQHSLAWKIHEKYKNFNIRLEKREKVGYEEFYFDICIFDSRNVWFLELKYKTERLECEIELDGIKERYCLKEHGAQSDNRYEFWKDVERLEKVVKCKNGKNVIGFAIFLTNDKSYWRNGETDCGIYDEREVEKSKELSCRKGKVKLKNEYTLRWKDYSEVKEETKNNKFRYLLLKIGKK